jgi:hypothetical protein
VLNTLEAPISEEEWAKRQTEKEKEKKSDVMAEEDRTMINQGGLAVVLPVALLGAGVCVCACPPPPPLLQGLLSTDCSCAFGSRLYLLGHRR